MECCGGKTNSGTDGGSELTNNLVGNSLVYTNTGTDLVSVSPGLNGQVLVQGAGGSVGWSSVSGTGTVTSVGISVPSYLSVGGSPITVAGTITISSVAGSEGQVLTTSSGVVGWQNLPVAGTVTSVGISVPNYLSVSNSPITGAGTISISSVAGSEGQVLTTNSGVVGWQNLPWASPGAIGSTTANTGTFTTLQNSGMLKSILSVSTIAYVSNAITFTAAHFSTGRIRFTGVASATTITTDTALNLVTQFGSVVGSTFVGHFTYVSTGAARAMTWNGGTNVTVYNTNGGNNQFYQQWVIVITSSTTVDFYIQ